MGKDGSLWWRRMGMLFGHFGAVQRLSRHENSFSGKHNPEHLFKKPPQLKKNTTSEALNSAHICF